MTKKLLRFAGVAKMTGYTLNTTYVYVSEGILPPPVIKIGNVSFFDPRDVRAHMALHADCARPHAQKSVRLARRGRSAS